jgi:hypothetical protein
MRLSDAAVTLHSKEAEQCRLKAKKWRLKRAEKTGIPITKSR